MKRLKHCLESSTNGIAPYIHDMCLNSIKQENEDFVSYVGTINSQCKLFKINEIAKDMLFKCLIFIQGLTASKDKDICSRILTIIEQDPEITLQKVTEESQRLINIKHDNTCIEEKMSCMYKG